MVLAIEPMVTAGRHKVRMGDDGWAIFSQDGSLAAHFEFTVAITADGPRVLTPWHEHGSRSAPELRSGPSASRPPESLCYSCSVALGASGSVLRARPRRGSGGRPGSQSRVAGTSRKGT